MNYEERNNKRKPFSLSWIQARVAGVYMFLPSPSPSSSYKKEKSNKYKERNYLKSFY